MAMKNYNDAPFLVIWELSHACDRLRALPRLRYSRSPPFRTD
jgi:hypothetical protein